MRVGVRARLVLGATIFAALAIGAALLIGRVALMTQLESATRDLARGDLESYAAELRANPDEPPDPPAPGILVRIVSPGGGIVVDTLPHEVAEHLPHDDDDTFRVETDEGSWLVVVERVETSAGTATLWAARDEAAVRESLDSVDVLFLGGGAGIVALFAVASTVFVRAALRPVEQARRRERQMVSDAAHELRTPLAGLRAQLSLARRESPDDSAVGRTVASAEESAARLSDLADNLLELARLEEDPTPARTGVDELRTAFLDAIDDIRATPAAREVTIEQSSSPEADPRTAGIDPVGFGRLVRNLLANAVAATGPGGTVLADLQAVGEELRLTVSDDGPGMAEAFLPRALERFARDDRPGSSGSGLGLALVKALTDAAGGRIVLHNTRPGLEAVVALPLS